MVSVAGDDDSDEEEKWDATSVTFCPLPEYVPCRCRIDAGGQTEVIVRALRHDDVDDFYSLVKDAAASGTGYGFNELPGLNYFIRWYIGLHTYIINLYSAN